MSDDRPKGVPGHWVKTAEGWSHPSRVHAGLGAASVGEQARALVSDQPASEGRARRVDAGDDRSIAARRTPRRTRQLGRPVVEVAIVMMAPRTRWMDGDNLGNAMKPVQDAAAAWLGVDDSDPRISWRFGQVESDTMQTLVTVSMLTP